MVKALHNFFNSEYYVYYAGMRKRQSAVGQACLVNQFERGVLSTLLHLFFYFPFSSTSSGSTETARLDPIFAKSIGLLADQRARVRILHTGNVTHGMLNLLPFKLFIRFTRRVDTNVQRSE